MKFAFNLHHLPLYLWSTCIAVCIIRQELSKREDLRRVPIVSIDPPGCTDIDDALHCRARPDGFFEVLLSSSCYNPPFLTFFHLLTTFSVVAHISITMGNDFHYTASNSELHRCRLECTSPM